MLFRWVGRVSDVSENDFGLIVPCFGKFWTKPWKLFGISRGYSPIFSGIVESISIKHLHFSDEFKVFNKKFGKSGKVGNHWNSRRRFGRSEMLKTFKNFLDRTPQRPFSALSFEKRTSVPVAVLLRGMKNSTPFRNFAMIYKTPVQIVNFIQK